MGTKLVYENHFECVDSDYAISVVNLGFLAKSIVSNDMGTKLAYKNQFESVGFFYPCVMISNLNCGFYDTKMFSNHMHGNTIGF